MNRAAVFLPLLLALVACSPEALPKSPAEAQAQLEQLGQTVTDAKADAQAAVETAKATLESTGEAVQAGSDVAKDVLQGTGDTVQAGASVVKEGTGEHWQHRVVRDQR